MQICDSELIMLIRENNEDALDIFNKRYTLIINKIINCYYKDLKRLDINIDDVTISCKEILNKALEQYNFLSDASFRTYLNILIKRNIKKIIIKAIRSKKKIIDTNFIDIENIDSYYAGNIKDPLNDMVLKENMVLLKEVIFNNLNKKELLIFSMMVDGFTYKDIAFYLVENYHKVYRYIQKIKKKLAPEALKIIG